ncbi:MAG: hypothetical protein U0935_16920 [Pirellulales bacterium]
MSAGEVRTFWGKSKKKGAATKVPLKASKLLDKLGPGYEYDKLRSAFDTYENIDPANDPTCSDRMTALREIDRQIFQWFQRTRAPVLGDVRGFKEMKALLEKAEKTHEALVEATKDDPQVLPFDTTNLSQQEVQDRGTLWRSLVAGDKQLKIGGSTTFQKKTRARMAKMLQTQTGFDILNYLNSPRQGQTGLQNEIVLGDKLPGPVKNLQHVRSSDVPVSYAKELDTDSSTKDIVGPTDADGNEDPQEFPTLQEPSDLRRAIFSGAKGIIVNGKKYTFGSGSGSFVKTVDPKPGSEDSDCAGENDCETVTPGFVTLAHELGHAVNIRSGSTTRNVPELMVALWGASNPTESTQQSVEDRWTNSEEFFNILNIENAIREENGIAKRVSHKPLSALRKMKRLKALYVQLSNVKQLDPCVSYIPEYEQAARTLERDKGQSDDEQVYTSLKNLLDDLEQQVTPTSILQFKRQDLTRRFATVKQKYTSAAQQVPPESDLGQRYEQLRHSIEDDLDTSAAVGTRTWERLRTEIREVGSLLPAGN